MSRHEPMQPDLVLSPTGTIDTSRRAKVFATIGGLLLAALVPLMWFGYTKDQPDITLEVIERRVVGTPVEDGRVRCALEIDVAMHNDGGDTWRIDGARAVIERQAVSLTEVDVPDRVGPETTARATYSGLAQPVTTQPCSDAADLNTGTLTVEYRRIGESGSGSASVGL